MTPVPLRAAVIGLGRMGMHHVRTCRESAAVDLVAVLDHRSDWAVQVGADHHCLVASDLQGLIGQIDLAIIAAPTSTHKDTALPLLEAGIACLVEKPIAAKQSEARAMMDAAQAGHASLCVGHVERFNPAVTALLKAVSQGSSIQCLRSRRLNTPSDRVYDVDCILDLMIHDLDLLNVIGAGDVTNIEGLQQANVDQAGVSITTVTGVEARLEVSRIAEEQHRELVVHCGESVYEVDYTARTLTHLESDTETPLSVEQGDPLNAQLAAFVDVVRGGDAPQIASGEDGYKALRLANQVREKLGLI